MNLKENEKQQPNKKRQKQFKQSTEQHSDNHQTKESKADILAHLLTGPGCKSNAEKLTNTSATNNLFKKIQSEIGPLNRIEDDIPGFPKIILENLKKLLDPITNTASLDDDGDEEYVEYVYQPRKYFLVSTCNVCGIRLSSENITPCRKCNMVYYCSLKHTEEDKMKHKELCQAIQTISECKGGHLYKKCKFFNPEEFRSYRLLNVRRIEDILRRNILPFEKEIILFPRLCIEPSCKEYIFEKLIGCKNCFQVVYCKNDLSHSQKQHKIWCKYYSRFHEIIEFQESFGKIDPALPTKILRDGIRTNDIKSIFNNLSCAFENHLEYIIMTQIATCPLTAWYSLKLTGNIELNKLTIHLIGSELEFEADVLQKWELFFLHITPSLKDLNIIFIGPELNSSGLSLEAFSKVRTCPSCRKNGRSINFFFENLVYHDYINAENFIKPNLVCFFNAGLHRTTGFMNEDSWPETIKASAHLGCSVVVTAYTKYECPLDFLRYVRESQKSVNVIMPPMKNPFASKKPERNFISDNEVPLIFKNFYFFIVK